MKKIIIDNNEISKNSSAYIIAELSANHNKSFEIAVKTIEAAKKIGADAIKFQTLILQVDTITINSKINIFK